MRPVMHALFGLLAAVAATPTFAELQWQASGVQQVSHNAPIKRAARPKVAAKAPTIVRQAQPQPKPVLQAVAAASPAPQAAQAAAVVVDPAVQRACGECGCDDATVMPYYESSACGVPGCGCGIEPGCAVVGEPTCGLTYGEPCGCGDIGCCGDCGDTVCGCGDVCDGSCGVPITLMIPPLRELTVDVGVQAFKNPLDNGRDRGNFGLNAGVNLGGAMSWLGFPGRWLPDRLPIDAESASRRRDARHRGRASAELLTAGLFHRKAVGLQYGVVYDLLRDERQGSEDFGQIRGLISVTNPRGHEIGFQFAKHLNDNNLNGTVYHATDQYLLFYRLHGCQGGEFRVLAGFDDDSKGILGSDFNIPLTDRFSLTTGFTYVIPEEDDQGAGAQQESWNVGMNLVWHYGCRAKRSFMSQYRPMFRVADNGSLIVDDRQP